ncbi:MAG: flagellar biosynthetic protein FliO [Clostridiales bacterium]|jgi:flagellar protein FliO/FliZ|nr:flagellar biosynthetic protein FliO [Clostridiales bacterium]
MNLKALLLASGDWSKMIGQFFYIILSFAAVAAMARLCAKWLAGAKRGSLNGSRLKTIEAMGVGLQASIQLVQVGERYLLLGVTKESVSLLLELSALDLPQAKGAKEASVFEGQLSRLLKNAGKLKPLGRTPDLGKSKGDAAL